VNRHDPPGAQDAGRLGGLGAVQGGDERAPHRSALSVPAEPSGKAGSASHSGRLPHNGPEPISPKMTEFNAA
jgi:hypothetical protein